MSDLLPNGWAWKRLGDIFDVQGGSQPDKSFFKYEPEEGYVRLLQIRDFGGKPVPTYVPKAKVTKFCKRNDVLIARYGASLGRIVTGMEGAYNVALAKLVYDHQLIYHRYIFYLFQTPVFQTPIHMISRSAQNGFNKGEVFPILLPIAPYEVQIKIVAEIEKQFSRLDEAVASLKRIQANLKRYKAAVLKAAVEGKLTEQWRKEHLGVEPADQLLKRILAERRARWETEELAKMKTKGIKPKDDSWKKKFNEHVGPETANLPELPEGWVWARAEQLCGFITKGTTPAANKLFAGEGDIPFIKVYNLTHRGLLDFSINPTFVSEYTHRNELVRSKVLPGDVLMNIVGPPLGKVSLVPDKYQEWNINQAVAIYRPVPGYNRKYLCHCLLTESVLSWATKRAKATAGQFNLTLELCRDLPLPLPPLKEQANIIEEIDRRLSVTEELEATIEINLKRAERLRQTILQKAFSGELITQRA